MAWCAAECRTLVATVEFAVGSGGGFDDLATRLGRRLSYHLDRVRCRVLAAGILTSLGDAYQGADDTAAARDAWQRALRHYEELGHPEEAELRARLTR
ncbi:hypothetical protein [Streptomyces sp. 6N223]|uniref:hypothetical protein n=1 Tax=Streptomyces sp. 6N223 TaxID=3457412 RepID=UPI003FD59CC3